MRIMKLAAAAGLAVSALTMASAPAAAQRDYGWRDDYGRWHDGDRDRWRDDNDGRRYGRYYRTNNGNHYGWRNHPRHRECRWVWRYHHRERICRWVRW